MSALTEPEIFSKIADGFAEGAALCDKIVETPLKGASYKRLIVVCTEIEGACRQAGHWRENYQWLVLGREVHQLQVIMGNWIRQHVRAKDMWKLAATTMRRLKLLSEIKRNQRHNVRGAILPIPGEGPERQRAVQVPRVTPGGIFVPEGVHVS